MDNSIAYNIGFAAGLALTVALMAALLYFVMKKCNKDGKIKTKHDEKQKSTIGKGYKIAYWTLIGCLILFLTINSIFTLPANFAVMVLTAVVISVMVFCAYSIWNDAFWGLNNNKKRYIVLFVLAGLMNLAFAAGAMVRGEMFADGMLQGAFINLMCAVLCFEVLGTLALKAACEK